MPFEVLDWPLQNQDLNLIKNFWSIMKEKIFEKTDIIDSIQTLENIVEDIFFKDETLF